MCHPHFPFHIQYRAQREEKQISAHIIPFKQTEPTLSQEVSGGIFSCKVGRAQTPSGKCSSRSKKKKKSLFKKVHRYCFQTEILQMDSATNITHLSSKAMWGCVFKVCLLFYENNITVKTSHIHAREQYFYERC